MSGARIVMTLISQLRDRGSKRGVAGICIGGGEATSGVRRKARFERQPAAEFGGAAWHVDCIRK